MPSFLSRLRAPRSSKKSTLNTADNDAVDVGEPHAVHRPLDASQASNSPKPVLDNRIAPNISALFASAEDELAGAQSEGLKPSRRSARRATTRHSSDGTEVSGGTKRKWKGKERAPVDEIWGKRSMDSGTSLARTAQTGWSTFGRDDNPSNAESKAFDRVRGRRSSDDNAHPVDADEVLSWSPKAEVSPESPKSSASSRSFPTSQGSPEAEGRHSVHSIFYSPSPRTFGHPTPKQITPPDTPALPFPPFQSTPRSSVTPFSSLPKTSPRSPLSRFRFATGVSLTPLSSTFGKVIRSQSERPKASNIFYNAPTTELGEQRGRTSSRLSTTSEAPPEPRRRQSAEWNAQAAAAGVAVSESQSQDFGWPAGVSREILRLSLGRRAIVQDALTPTKAAILAAAAVVGSGPDMASASPSASGPGRSRKGKSRPRVSHELHTDARPPMDLMRAGDAEQGLPSSPSRLLHFSPPSSSFSSSKAVPTGLAEHSFEKAATHDGAPHPAAFPEDLISRLSSPPDNVLDAPDAHTHPHVNVEVARRMDEHRRGGSEGQVEWNSRQLQDFIVAGAGAGAGEENAKEGGGGSTLLPGTPIKPSASASTYQTAGSSSFLHAPSLSVIAPTPQGSPNRSKNESPTNTQPVAGEGLQVSTPLSDKSKGKRKAEDSEDGSPPGSRGSKGKKTTFAAEGKRPHLSSTVSHAPSSFQSAQSQKSRKRVRLSSPMSTPDQSLPESTGAVGTVSSLTSLRSAITGAHFQRPSSRASSARGSGPSPYPDPRTKHRSLSQTSIPLSAIVSPHPPSIDRLSTFHMRDPRRPPSRRTVGWRLRFAEGEDKGSPLHAWAFWFGFFLPLFWWIASVWRIPRTRMVGTDTEKAVIVDDPHVEQEARTWRIRCRVAAVLFFFTYAPVIVLLAIFVPR
ncbi:hypothetical protein M0805_001458 [Coniferiporia weirii]|nr:hypothetical protein M0805_001458 [Coniferiporia weirii]